MTKMTVYLGCHSFSMVEIQLPVPSRNTTKVARCMGVCLQDGDTCKVSIVGVGAYVVYVYGGEGGVGGAAGGTGAGAPPPPLTHTNGYEQKTYTFSIKDIR